MRSHHTAPSEPGASRHLPQPDFLPSECCPLTGTFISAAWKGSSSLLFLDLNSLCCLRGTGDHTSCFVWENQEECLVSNLSSLQDSRANQRLLQSQPMRILYTWPPRWCRGSGRGMDWEFGIGRCKLLFVKWINNRVLLCGTWWWFSSVVQSCPTLATPWTVARQAPLSMGFSRQEYWSGLPFPSPGDLPDPGIKPRSPALQADSLLTELRGKPVWHREQYPISWVQFSPSVVSDYLISCDKP